MTLAKIFQCPVKDEFGGVFPDALVAVFKGECSMGLGFGVGSADEHRVYSSSVNVIAYEACYVYKKEFLHIEALRSLKTRNDDGSFNSTHNVDVDHPEIVRILSSNATAEDKLDQAIEMDIRIKNS